MARIEENIVEHTRLAKEFASMKVNSGDTPEEVLDTENRKAEIKNNIQKLKHELLFEQYLKLQSNEFKEDLINYEPFSLPEHDIAIKVNFTWGWLRVYRNKNNQIEWY